MKKSLGLLFLIFGTIVIIGIGAMSFKADYWLSTPKEKFIASWQDDVRLLQKTRALPAAWEHIREVEVKSDSSPTIEWVDGLKPQVKIDPNGTFKLNIMVIHWVEKSKYGAIVQYSITDLKSGNTVWEISRTLHLGYLI